MFGRLQTTLKLAEFQSAAGQGLPYERLNRGTLLLLTISGIVLFAGGTIHGIRQVLVSLQIFLILVAHPATPQRHTCRQSFVRGGIIRLEGLQSPQQIINILQLKVALNQTKVH